MTNSHRRKNLLFFALILITGSGLALALPWLFNAHSLAAHQNYITTTSGTCYATFNNGATEYDDVQKAVDAASPGDVIKLAGTCAGVATRAGLTQTVYISQPLRLEGGHTPTDWRLTPDPKKYPTILDADGGGRVILITGTNAVYLEGISLTGGLADDGTLDNNGGGIWSNSEFTLTNSIIFSNTAVLFGGGLYNRNVSPVLTNVIFSGNSADSGGAMENWGPKGISSPNLTNVAFYGNAAVRNGGAIYNYGYDGVSNPKLTNVTFSGNSAGHRGGAMYNYGTDGTSLVNAYNSIIWNNKALSGTNTIDGAIYNNNAFIILSYSLVEGSGGSGSGWIGGSYVDGTGNTDADPLFIAPVNPDEAPTSAGNLRLREGSPAVDAGNNDYAQDVPTDLDGNERIISGVVDLGAYEKPIITFPLIFR